MPMLGGFGSPGVRETKQVSESTEVSLPFRQFLGIWFVGVLISFFGYLLIKMFVTDRGDWSLLIGILTPIVFIAGAVFFDRQIAKRFFPNVYLEFIEWNKRFLDRDDFGPVILYMFVLANIILVSAWFYLSVIVPQLVIMFDQRAHFVFVLCAFGSLLIAARPYYIFNKRQLTDSLRDSDSRYAIRSLELEHESYWKRVELDREDQNARAALSDSTDDTSTFHLPVLIRAPDKNLPEPSPADMRLKDAVMDFLEGIVRGSWSTNERSWRSVDGRVKILPTTGHRVASVGKQIRDELIRAGWASWKNPDDRSTGWELNFDIGFIEKEAFNDDNRIREAPRAISQRSGETPAGDNGVFVAGYEYLDDGEGDID